jgi:hypothetical protein
MAWYNELDRAELSDYQTTIRNNAIYIDEAPWDWDELLYQQFIELTRELQVFNN